MDFVRAGGARLEIVWQGPAWADGAGLVFLHEGLGSIGHWRDFPLRCAQATGLPALVYSRQGYGRSDPSPRPRPLDYLRREAGVLCEILQLSELTRPILFGHSDGATLALHYAASRALPEPFGLVCESPHVFLEPKSVASITVLRESFLRGGPLRERLAKYHADVDGAFHGWADAWLDPAFAQAIDLADDLPRLRAPALLIQEDQDPYGTLAQLDRIQAQSPRPTTRLVLEGSDHAPHRTHPTEVIAALRAFVDGL